jgi:hypothetical protein
MDNGWWTVVITVEDASTGNRKKKCRYEGERYMMLLYAQDRVAKKAHRSEIAVAPQHRW